MGRAPAPGACGLIAALLLCLLASLGLPAAEARAAAQGLQVGLEGAAFKDFLLFMGQFSGQNPVFRADQLPDATVTLVARQSVDEAELAEMQALVLGVAGLTAIPRGEVVYLLPDSKRPVRADGPTQILVERLNQGLAPGQVAHVLERLRSDSGQVAAGPGRWVVIRDRAERVARAREVLAALEAAPAGARLELEPLRRAEARLAARKLDMHFRGLPGRPPVVLALAWSNSVLLAGDAAQLDQGVRLLARMDEGGREAPALKAFRLRHARTGTVAAAIGELAASDARLAGLRVRVDDAAGAVVVLAEPEAMARVERLVAELDQPRPRVLLEALVLELPRRSPDRDGILTVIAGPDGAAPAAKGPQPAGQPEGAPAGTRGFAQVALGQSVRLRGRAPEGPLAGLAALDALAAQLAADPEIRVLARPRAAVPDGGEMRLSITRPDPAGAGPGVERQRLVFTPLQDPEGGRVSVRVSLVDAEAPGRPQAAQALVAEGALLLLVADGPDRAAAARNEAQGEARDGTGRLAIVLSARVVRGGEPAAGAGRDIGETKP